MRPGLAMAALLLVAVCLQLAAPMHRPATVCPKPTYIISAERATPSRGTMEQTFIATAYVPTGKLTKFGTLPVVGITIAVDPSVIPLGSKVRVNGVEKVATDTGSKVKGRRIDLLVADEKTALTFGVQLVGVEVVPNNP